MGKNKEKKRVTFPQMGNLAIPVSAMLKKMGAEVVLPPQNNKETLSLGTRYSVETVCLPYKLILGNFIQAIEQGANTVLMFQAPGTCRLGNYADNINAKLKEMGYGEVEFIIFDLYKGKLKEISSKFALATDGTNIIEILQGIRIGFAKFDTLDVLERKLFYTRARELNKGEAERVYLRGKKAIDDADTVSKVKKAALKSLKEFDTIALDASRDVLKVYLTGEFYVLLDPFTNMEIERELGHLGCEVDRQVMLSDWTNNALLPKFMYRELSHRDRSVLYAKNYMQRAIGGDCIESVGDAVYASHNNVDGVVHVGPFTCTPEVVSQSILPHVSRNEDIPVLSLIMDEQSGKAGVVTRLEAFVDLIRRRRMQQETAATSNKELVLCK